MERWSSRGGFVLAAIGAAVGLGNIWRFSTVVGQNGGGAYLIPYLLAAFVFALPLLVLELSVGRDYRTDVVTAFRSVDRRFEILGWLVTGSVLLILSYYLVLTGWVMSFFVGAASGIDLTFQGYTDTYWPLLAFGITTVLTGGIVTVGVRSGIEPMAKVVMPAVFVVLVGLAAYATTLGGFARGVEFLFTPDLGVLADPFVWSAAFGQVFFSLSVGQGIMLTYGSYLQEEVDIVRSSLLITLADIGVAIVAGLVIFPIVFSFQELNPSLGTELAFSTLPAAFEVMRFGIVIAIAFFGLLFLAALSSAVSLLEVGVAALTRTTGRSRRQIAPVLTAIIFGIGLPSALSYSALELSFGGVLVLDWMDETVGTLALPVTAFLIAVVFTWFQDHETLRNQLGTTSLVPVLKYAIPVVLFVVTTLKLLSRFEIPAWQALPEVGTIRPFRRILFIVVAFSFLLVFGRRLIKYRRSRREQES